MYNETEHGLQFSVTCDTTNWMKGHTQRKRRRVGGGHVTGYAHDSSCNTVTSYFAYLVRRRRVPVTELQVYDVLQ
jgi:hypothetical protein